MEGIFIESLEFTARELYSCSDFDTLILEKLKSTYINKCVNTRIIKEIININHRDAIIYTRNRFPAIAQTSVHFAAKYVSYSESDLILIKITKIEQKRLIAESEDYIAYLDISNIPLKLAEGQYLIVVIAKLLINPKKKMIFRVVMFNRPTKFQITHIIKAAETKQITQATQLCVDAIKSIDQKKLSDIFSIFHRTSQTKWAMEKYSIYGEIDTKLYDGKIAYFVINPFDAIEDGQYYLTDNIEKLSTLPNITNTEAISLEYMVHKYAASIQNFIKVIAAVGQLSEEEFKANGTIWAYYKR